MPGKPHKEDAILLTPGDSRLDSRHREPRPDANLESRPRNRGEMAPQSRNQAQGIEARLFCVREAETGGRRQAVASLPGADDAGSRPGSVPCLLFPVS